MSARIVPRASIHEILAFLKGRGIVLSDEAIRILEKKLEEEPLGRPALERSRIMSKNPVFKDILDWVMVERSNRIQKIADSNPFLKMIDDKRRISLDGGSAVPREMPEPLRKVFYDEQRWQPYAPYFGIPGDGQIIKVFELDHPDLPYIGFLKDEGERTHLYSTRRKLDLDRMRKTKFYRLRDGVFQYEIDEIKDLERRYLQYIMSHHR